MPSTSRQQLEGSLRAGKRNFLWNRVLHVCQATSLSRGQEAGQQQPWLLSSQLECCFRKNKSLNKVLWQSESFKIPATVIGWRDESLQTLRHPSARTHASKRQGVVCTNPIHRYKHTSYKVLLPLRFSYTTETYTWCAGLIHSRSRSAEVLPKLWNGWEESALRCLCWAGVGHSPRACQSPHQCYYYLKGYF